MDIPAKNVPKFKPGKAYHIKFYDHFIGENEELTFDFIGFFTDENKNYAFFSNWKSDDKEARGDHDEKNGIVKSLIFYVKEIKSPHLQ